MKRMFSVGEVAAAFGVDSKTVNRWARRGLIDAFRTPGGHFRISAEALAGRLPEEALRRLVEDED